MNRLVRMGVLFFMNFLLAGVLAEANSSLSGFGVSLHLEMLFIVFCGLYLDAIPGMVMTAGLGFFLGVFRPVPLEDTLIEFLLLWLFSLAARRRIRRENFAHVAGVAALAQCLAIIGMSFAYGADLVGSGVFWGRVFGDAALSMLIVAVLAYLWCQFQVRILMDMGWNPDAQH